MAGELKVSVEDFQEALLQISNSTIVALDELWSVSDSTGDAISLLDTLPDRRAPDPEQLMDQSELRDRIADSIAALPERETLIVIGLVALFFVIGAFTASVGLGILTLVILAPLGALLYAVYTRVILEFIIVVFRIAEYNRELVELTRAQVSPAVAASAAPTT